MAILIGHPYAPEGLTFVCTEYGTVREFKTVDDALDHMADCNLDITIYSVMQVSNVPVRGIPNPMREIRRV